MLTPGQLAQCRMTHETILTDKLRIRHDEHTDGPFDVALGYAPTVAVAPFYDGPGRLQARSVQPGDRGGGSGNAITVLGYVAVVPWGVVDVRPSDIVECYESADPRNVGKFVRVADVQSSTYETARRMSCVDYQPQVKAAS